MKGIQCPKIVLRKPSFRRGVFIVLLSCIPLTLFAVPVPAEAIFGVDVGGLFRDALIWAGAAIFGLVFWIFNWIGILVLTIASLVLQAMMSFVLEAGYTPYTDLSVLVGWRVVRDIAHMVLIFALLAIGISTILGIRLNDNDDSVGKQLITFVAIAIVIHFTPLITGVIIDISNIFTKIFFDQAQSAVGGFSDHHPFASSWNDFIKLGSAEDAAAYSLGLIVSVFYSLGAAIILFATSFLLIARVIAIQLLVIFSPLAFVAQLIPKGKKMFDTWLQQFLQWCFLPVGLGLFLWLSAVILANGMTACTDPTAYNQQFQALGGENTIGVGHQSTVNLGISNSNTTAQTAVNSIVGGENLCKATVSIMALATIVAGLFVSATTSAKGASIITRQAKSAFLSGSKLIARGGIRSAGFVTKGVADVGGRGMDASGRKIARFSAKGLDSQFGKGKDDRRLKRVGGRLLRGAGELGIAGGYAMKKTGDVTQGIGAGLDYASKAAEQGIKDPSSLKDLPATAAQDYIQSRAKGGIGEAKIREGSRVLRRLGVHDTADNIQRNLDKIGDLSEVREKMKDLPDQALEDTLANPDIWNTEGGKKRGMVAFEMLSQKPKGREKIQNLVRDGKVDLDKISKATEKYKPELKYGRNNIDAHVALAALSGNTSNLSDSDKREAKTLKGKWNRESSREIRNIQREYEDAKLDSAALTTIATNSGEQIEQRMAALSLLSDKEIQDGVSIETQVHLAQQAKNSNVEVGRGQDRYNLSDRLNANLQTARTNDPSSLNAINLTQTGIEAIEEGAKNYNDHLIRKSKIPLQSLSLEELKHRAGTAEREQDQMNALTTIAEVHGYETFQNTVQELQNKDALRFEIDKAQNRTTKFAGTGKNNRGGIETGDLFRAYSGDADTTAKIQEHLLKAGLERARSPQMATSKLEQTLSQGTAHQQLIAATELFNRGHYDAINNAGLSADRIQAIEDMAENIDLTNEGRTQQETKNKQAFTLQEVAQALSDQTMRENVVARSEQASHTSIQNQFLQGEGKNKTIDIEKAIQILNNERTDNRTKRGIVSSILASNDGERVFREKIMSGEIRSLPMDNDLNKYIQTNEGVSVQKIIEGVADEVGYDDQRIVYAKHPNMKNAPNREKQRERDLTEVHRASADELRQIERGLKEHGESLRKQQSQYEEMERVELEKINNLETLIQNQPPGSNTQHLEQQLDQARQKIQDSKTALERKTAGYKEKHERAEQKRKQTAYNYRRVEDIRRGRNNEREETGGGDDNDRGSGDSDPTPPVPPSGGGDDKPPPEVYRQPAQQPYAENIRDRAVRRHNNRAQREIVTEETERDALRADTQRTQETPPQTPTREGHRRANENLQTKPRQKGIRTARKQANERRGEWERAAREHDRREAQQEQEGPLRERWQQAQEQLQREERERDEKEYKEWAENEVLNQEIAEEEQWEREEKRQELERKEQERKKDLKEYTERLDREKEERERELERREREFREQGREEARREAQKLTNQNREEQEERQRQEEEERRDAVERSQPQRKSDSDTERSRKRQDARRRKQSPNRNQDDDANGTQQPRSRRSDRRRRRRERDLQNQQEAQENNGLEPYEDMAQDFMQDEWDDN
ncbi:MAG: hypothetical protein F4X82_02485 [Candidatus Spechtbacteria bacterium SB0662_bin_43]|uniref:Uncharacterized protein n=1 Tax=Candidatus Spechtbacteria bacterium SB0662_bin_43 TaxID=2604897 RepID=A0A845DJI9_9BACT|nr:hypothetical protein [Candidatus Spechtbacteria bacterium SB0662_bin_43]